MDNVLLFTLQELCNIIVKCLNVLLVNFMHYILRSTMFYYLCYGRVPNVTILIHCMYTVV